MLQFLKAMDNVMYYPILLIVLGFAAFYFTGRTRFVQVRHFRESLRIIFEKPADDRAVSSFQALMVSTASRVGTGNIVGVSTAICMGGPGAVFWMWLLAFFGASSAFIESTLAQIFKKKNKETGEYFGGPAYYIETALHSKFFAGAFVVFLMLTYGVGFNMLASFNLQSTFATYDFYHPKNTPLYIGAILALLVGIVLFGGGKRIVRITEIVVPVMGVLYVLASLIVLLAHVTIIPSVVHLVIQDAFNFKAIFSGMAGSCMIYGIKRGLYSNEAGVGSAPNASASADVTHPVKQGLVQMLSVYIDTLLLCSATAIMCLSSGILPSVKLSGAPYVQQALSTVFGSFGPIFITIAMILFAFTTLIGNLYYVDNAVAYLNHKKKPGKGAMTIIHIICVLVIFVGAVVPMDAAWALADISMGLMTLINLPACFLLSSIVIHALRDYEEKRKTVEHPAFKGEDIGLYDLDCWQ